MTLEFNYVEDSELPYRVTIDGVHGAGITEKKAIMAALRVAKYIPEGMTDTKRAYAHIFWNYEVGDDWEEIIRRLAKCP